MTNSLALATDARKEQENTLRETIQLAQSVHYLTHTVDEAAMKFEETVMELVQQLPTAFAHGLVSLGHRSIASWLVGLSWLSLSSITQWLLRLSWAHPTEVS